MIRLAVAAGLIALFALGYAGLERIALSEPRRDVGVIAQAHARYAATQGALSWTDLVERTRGLVRSTAADLEPVVADEQYQRLEAPLVALIDRAGGRASAAVVAPDGRKLLAVGNGIDLDPSARAVKDARAGATTVHLERVAAKPVLIAASPIEGRAVLALSVPLDRRLLRTFALELPLSTSIALTAANGEVLMATDESGLADTISPSEVELQIRDDRFVLQRRQVFDDGGVAGTILGLSRLETAAIADLQGRLRLTYGVIAIIALLLVMLVLWVAPARLAKEEEEPAEEVDLGSVGAPERSVAENLLAAARVLDYDGERTPLPGHESTPGFGAPSAPGFGAHEPAFSAPPAERSLPPRPTRPEPIMQSHEPVSPQPDLEISRSSARRASEMRAPPPQFGGKTPAPFAGHTPAPFAGHTPAPAFNSKTPAPFSGAPAQRGSDFPSRLPSQVAPPAERFPAPSSGPPQFGGQPSQLANHSLQPMPPPSSRMPEAPSRNFDNPIPREIASRVSGELSRFLVGSNPPQAGGAAAAADHQVTLGRGMSPPPPNVSPNVASASTMSRGDVAPMPGGTPLPQLEAVPADLPLANYAGPRQSAQIADRDPFRAFDEDHYRSVFDEFVGSKQRLGEVVENISYEGFSAKLRRSEQQLIDKHGCRSVRFQVVVRDRQVSLRPQLVR